MRGTPAIIALTMIASTSLLSPARAQVTPVHVSTLPIAEIANLYAAIQEGYFKMEGLDVTTEANQQGGAVGIPGLVAGAYDVAYSNTPTILLAAQQGIDLRIIATPTGIGDRPPDPAALLALKAENLHTGKDMEGKSIAVNVRNGLQWMVARGWVKAKGGDPDKVTYREVAVPQMTDALKARQVDAALSIDPFMTIALRDPTIEILGWPLSTVLPNIQVSNFVVTAETATKRSDMVNKFIRGMNKGSDWVNANLGKEPFFKLVNSYTKMDPALLAQLVVKKSGTETNVDSLKRLAALMRDSGLLTTDIDVAKIVYRPSPP